MEVIERRKRVRDRVIEQASDWAAKIPFKVTAILIGSYAKGDFNLWSDIDILLVSPSFEGSPIERLKALDIPPGFQAIPLTPEEFRKQLVKRNPIAVEAVESGIVLREDIKLIPTEAEAMRTAAVGV